MCTQQDMVLMLFDTTPSSWHCGSFFLPPPSVGSLWSRDYRSVRCLVYAGDLIEAHYVGWFTHLCGPTGGMAKYIVGCG
jgi:hypothetical protein